MMLLFSKQRQAARAAAAAHAPVVNPVRNFSPDLTCMGYP
jgi:hypothetical protein